MYVYLYNGQLNFRAETDAEHIALQTIKFELPPDLRQNPESAGKTYQFHRNDLVPASQVASTQAAAD